MPINGEVDTSPLIDYARAQQKNCYLPIVQPNNTMQFAHYLPNTPMQTNAWHIPEPISNNIIAPESLSLVLVPLLAFNQQRHRLGYGKGYYDHTFAFRQDNQQPKKPTLFGLAYDFQQAPPWPE